MIPGKNVVIVGGGAVGCETAQLLSRNGAISEEQLMFLTVHQAEEPDVIRTLVNTSTRNVTIVEIMPKLGSGFDPGCAWPVMKDLKRLKVATHTSSKITEVTDSFAVIEKTTEAGTERIEIPCDTIILAVGSVSENRLYNELSQVGANVHIIGDAGKTGRVLDAIEQALDLACVI